ncbi:DUF1080 domain-containing protein [Pontibacter sp. G13]|uniref:3-keto-disaccharide hydrolase n=1 Tax=Pontibacter sp. G13 TaxID=3074898 RepID=UPI00288A75DB|nr:DUF1080 domain-containing protein [Pontibacter sp. G13]WNJ17343.1 DUF1080 domain-containing protein [Pontibacter sp. G13]
MKINYLFRLLCLMLLPVCSQAQDAPWQSLFNGENLKGWKQLNGEAPYRVEDGMIIGTTVKNTPNSFLCTKDTYSDFILEYDVWVDPAINSGVQIRSNSIKSYRKGRVHGYQVELDPSSRAWSGGIFDEARRGWLYPLSRNQKGSAAFRPGAWNHVRVEAIGNSINTWMNGIQCARLVDDMTSEGFIGLQVHAIGGDAKNNREIKWKNLRIMTEDLEAHRTTASPDVPEISYLKNELTETEVRNGWRLLWDGETSNGWRGAKRDDFPPNGWTMEDGVLTILATDGEESTGPGDIVTEDQFSNFELVLEFQITEGANSGIKYFVDPSLNKGSGSAIGCEFQILDDKNHPDAKKGTNGNRTVGSLYDLMTAESIEYPERKKPFKGIGSWNHARIVSKDGKVEHWLNNEKVIEYDRHSQIFRALVAYSKYKNWENFGQWPEGHILLQDHGDTVHFRSIKIREMR